MGQLISLTDRIIERDEARQRVAGDPAAFFFALNCPLSYLIAERVERDYGEIAWVPVLAPQDMARARERLGQARALAASRRLAMSEPENYPCDVRPVSRAAWFASRQDDLSGAAFALRAMRLAFAGGFDLADPDLIAEAAAAAGLPVDRALAAAGDGHLDRELTAAARRLRARGIVELPVLELADGLFSGFAALRHAPRTIAARGCLAAVELA